MPVSVEAYTLVNLCMNVTVLGIIARSDGCVRFRQILLASVVGTAYAVAMQTEVFHLLRALPLQILLPFVMAAIALNVEKPMDLMKGGMKLLLATAFLAATQQVVLRLFGLRTRAVWILGAALGAAALAASLKARMQRLEKWEVRLVVRTRRGQTQFRALIDTGNRLHEPISGLPVLIVEERRLKRLLPEGFDARSAALAPPPGFRLVSYGALGGAGKMAVFRPDEVLASYGDGWMRAPDIWVAVYPGAMPGDICALAPPVIGRIQSMSKSIPNVSKHRMERGMRR